MTPLELFLPCEPPTTSHHRKNIVHMRVPRVINGRSVMTRQPRLADDKTLVAAKRLIDGLLRPYRPTTAELGPVTLTLEFTWSWRTSDSKRIRGRGRIPKATRPDCSNLAKTTEDRLVANGFLGDDGQVVELVVRKYFGATPGIGIALAPVVDAPLFESGEPHVPASV